jgi:hypothetical protein
MTKSKKDLSPQLLSPVADALAKDNEVCCIVKHFSWKWGRQRGIVFLDDVPH